MDEFNIADSWEFGNPAQMEHLAGMLLDRYPEIPLVLHIHDTPGMGLANVLACLQVGVTTIDTALGGMEAHPILPGAQGGICTEDLVHMLNLMGVNTGVDLDALMKVSMMVQEIVGHELRGRIIKVGKTFTTYPRPDSFSWPDRY